VVGVLATLGLAFVVVAGSLVFCIAFPRPNAFPTDRPEPLPTLEALLLCPDPPLFDGLRNGLGAPLPFPLLAPLLLFFFSAAAAALLCSWVLFVDPLLLLGCGLVMLVLPPAPWFRCSFFFALELPVLFAEAVPTTIPGGPSPRSEFADNLALLPCFPDLVGAWLALVLVRRLIAKDDIKEGEREVIESIVELLELLLLVLEGVGDAGADWRPPV